MLLQSYCNSEIRLIKMQFIECTFLNLDMAKMSMSNIECQREKSLEHTVTHMEIVIEIGLRGNERLGEGQKEKRINYALQ